jgi:hypothetical protein
MQKEARQVNAPPMASARRRGMPLSDVSNSPRARTVGYAMEDGCSAPAAQQRAHQQQPQPQQQPPPPAQPAPAQVSAEVMRKADQMLVRATQQIVVRNEEIAQLRVELRSAQRRARHGGDESSERRLQALRREYDQAEAVRELRVADAKMQLHRHEREAQQLQRRLDEQKEEMTALTSRARRAEGEMSGSAERHRAAMALLKDELAQLEASKHAEAAAAARELRAAREELQTEAVARKAAAQTAAYELQRLQEAVCAEAEQLGAAREHSEELSAQVQALRGELRATEDQRKLDLEASSAARSELADEADCVAQRLADTHKELCEMEQAADTAMAGWNEEKVVRVRLQEQAAQEKQAAAAAAAMEQSMALATIAEMQQLRAENTRLATELQKAAVLHRTELDGLKTQLADAVCKADASDRTARKQTTREQEDAASAATIELESVRAQLRSQREIEDATSATNRELEDVRAQLADEMEARLNLETKWQQARDASVEVQAELDTLKQEHELQQLVVAAAPTLLPSPSPMPRLDVAQFEQEHELRAEAESQVQQEKELRSQAESELEQAVAIGEEATSKVETLTAELAAAQKGRGALLLEIEHQHAACTAASERVKECETEADEATNQVAELQNDLAAAARLLDAASTGLGMEKRRSAALSQQVALVMTEARRTAEAQDAEMGAWITLGTRYGTRFGSARTGSTPSPSKGEDQTDSESMAANTALTPWHTPGMARWPSLSPMSLSRARAPASQTPSISPSPGGDSELSRASSAFATLDRCDQLIEQLEEAEEQVEAAAERQLETVHLLQDDVAKLHVHTASATAGVTWADQLDEVAVAADSPNTVRRRLVTDIRRMLLAPAAGAVVAAAAAEGADGLGQLIAQQQEQQQQERAAATAAATAAAVVADVADDSSSNCSNLSVQSVEESALEQSLRSELDDARVELMAGDRVELAGKAALAGAHRAAARAEDRLRKAEAQAAAAEQRCIALSAELAEREAAAAAASEESKDEGTDGAERMSVICPDGVQPGQVVEVEAPSGQLMQVIVPDGVQPGEEFDVDVSVDLDPEPEPELVPEPEPEPEQLQMVVHGGSLLHRMKEAAASDCKEEEGKEQGKEKGCDETNRTLLHRMKAVAVTQERERLDSEAVAAAAVGAAVDLMVARTEAIAAQDEAAAMKAAAAAADDRAVRAATELHEERAAFQQQILTLSAPFEQRLAESEEARLCCEERLASTLEELSSSLELSVQRGSRLEDVEMELATAEDTIVGLRDDLAEATEASLAASRNKMAMVEEWKAQRASLSRELKDCTKCKEALVAENDGLRRRLRAEGKPGTPMRTPGKKLTLLKGDGGSASGGGRSRSVLRQTVGSAEISPQTTPERPRWNRV